MNYTLKYGKREVSFDIDEEKVISVLQLKDKNYVEIKDVKKELFKSLNNPLSFNPLKKIIKEAKPKNAVVIVEDITRANPYYPEILSSLLSYFPEKLRKNTIFLIALGTHRPHSKSDNIRVYGEYLVRKCKFVNHNCDEGNEYIGTTSFGNRIFVNKIALECDLLIVTGSIDTHSFAGYSGTRKSILPGIASRESITFNHSFVVDVNSNMGSVEENKLHLDMFEAAEKFIEVRKPKQTFFINFIKNHKKQLIKILSGSMEAVHKKGVQIARKLFSVPIKLKSDLTIVSCGGYPRDINLYQAQKSLTCASLATKVGGTIILVAECCEGVGQEVFAKWLIKKSISRILNTPQEKIVVEAHRAYLTAKLLKDYDCILVSDMDKKLVKRLKFRYAEDIKDAIEYVRSKYNDRFDCYIIPNGSSVLPCYKK